MAVQKRLIDNEPSRLFDCHRLSTLKQRPRLQIDWRQQKGALFILIYFFRGKGVAFRFKFCDGQFLWLRDMTS